MTFEAGDRVVLISGGPLMTVIEDSEEAAAVKCMWFDQQYLRHIEEFPAKVLRNIDPGKGGH